MAAFTSKATGNWNAVGQTTWNEVGYPDGADDTATIQNGHTVTLNTAELVGQYTINAGGTLTIAEDCGLDDMNAQGLNNGTLLMALGSYLKMDDAADLYVIIEGAGATSTLTGTAAKVITLQNEGAGNLYFKLSDNTVWKFVDVYGIPYENRGENVLLEDCDMICWAAVSTPRQPFWRMKRCFISGYGNDWRINPNAAYGFDPQWENIVVGYRRNGAAAAVNRAFVVQQGRLHIRNFIGNYTTLMASDGEDTALVIDNMGHVCSAMLPGTGSALDNAVVDAGVSLFAANARGVIERSVAAKKTGDFGARFSPVAGVDTNHPHDAHIYIPIATGDNISVSVWVRRTGMTNDCAKMILDTEEAWFTSDTSAEVLTNINTWYELTASANGAGGTNAEGMVRVVLRVDEVDGANTVDFADMTVTAGGIDYTVDMDMWSMGMPVANETAAAGGGSGVFRGVILQG